MKLLDLLNVIEDDTPIWIYIDYPFPCRKEGLFFGAVQFAAENDSEWEAYRWNEEHAEIEVVTGMDTSALAEHFMGLAKELDPYIEREAWDWGENHPDVLRHKEARKFWASVAERLKK